MISKTLTLCCLALGLATAGAAPLRVFIRSGPKTHGPGAHDHPAFLRDWTKLLNERGAKATGGDTFPSADQLAGTDVLILHAENAGDVKGDERTRLEAYLARGGGIVAIHAGTVSRDPNWYKSIIGGSWHHGQTRWLEGHLSLYFTDRENPITRECSNFDLDDEIYYDMDLLPGIQVLAAAYTPNPKDGRAKDTPAHAALNQVSVYDIQPQIWTYQAPKHRAFVMVPGHLYDNFSHVSIRTMILRGIAWAGGRDNADELCKPGETGDALRYPANGPVRPELAAEKIEVHPEFDLSLVAAEPLIQKAMNVDWDEKGRLWVAETPEYPNGLRRSNVEAWKDSGALKPGTYDRAPADRISNLTDTDGDGRMDRKHVFADKLELVTSFVLHKNAVIAAAAPDIWLLEDTNGDEVADKRSKLYTGLGTGDTHAVINNLRWGLDGWVYATHGYSAGKVTAVHGPANQEPVAIGSGVVRFLPDGTKFEQYSSKGGNTWGLDITWDGEVFWTQPTSGTVFFHTLLPESILAKAKLPDATGWKGMVTNQPTYPAMKWEQIAYRQIDQVGRFTAAAGCAIYEGGVWPERWNRSYFTGEPTINIVSHFFTKPDGPSVTPFKESGREETEFLRSRDLWFRPIETRIGPDGALYVIDFYNQAVVHNDTRGPRHGPANAAVRPDRDHYFGRIWRVQHKQAKDLGKLTLDRNDTAGLVKVLRESPNGPRKHIAWRLLRENVEDVREKDLAAAIIKAQGSAVQDIYQNLTNPTTPAMRTEILNRFAAAGDNWTRTALVAAASDAATATVVESLASSHGPALAPLVRELAAHALRTGTPADAPTLLIAASKAPAAAASLQAIILNALAAAPERAAPLDDALTAAFTRLLDNEQTSITTLPILAAWDRDGKLASLAKAKSESLARTLADAKAPAGSRSDAGRALIRLGDETSLAAVLATLADPSTDAGLQRTLIETLGSSGQADRLVPGFGKLAEPLRPAAYDAILKRADASLALLKSLADGSLPATLLGPGDLARLRSHPDKRVSRQALGLSDTLEPGAKDRAGIIATLTPEVSKPGGDPIRGKTLFAGVCAGCHKYEDLGKLDVGPPLTGMGAHGPAELLVHIVDPNREVDPSFWQWNVTTRASDTHAGVIVSENADTLTLRNTGGDVTIRKSDIAKRENTRRSLMPEGLHALGADGLRDLLAFMSGGDSPHRVLDLRSAFTADGRRGLFAREEATGDTITPQAFGNVNFEKIPFFLMDPAKSRDGSSLIVLKGGGGGNFAQSHPQRVEIPVGFTARRFHLLSGVAGWGYPATADRRVALKVTINRMDGGKEIVDLANGTAFADYNREIDVPGSKTLPGATRHGHLRLISLDLRQPGEVKSLTLESLDNGISPVVAAITAETRSTP